MGYVTARQSFESAKSSDDEALRQLADGLVQLSRAIEADFNKLERKIEDVERKVR